MPTVSRSPPLKEAVVFILDGNPSMEAPYPPTVKEEPNEDGKDDDESMGKYPTRLECAKQVIESMLMDMIINSYKGSEALVIVTKTAKTDHHWNGDPDEDEEIIFPNLTELGRDRNLEVMKPPDAQLIRELWEVQPVESLTEAQQHMQGDIIDALILAADALYRLLHKGKTMARRRCKIVLITDACHPVVMDVHQTLLIIDNLRKMECLIDVLGLGFGLPTVEYLKPQDASTASPQKQQASSSSKRIKREDSDGNAYGKDAEPGHAMSSGDGVDSDGIFEYNTVEDRELLLRSLAQKTGGSVVSVSSMQELLDSKAGKRTRNSTARKIQLHVGPGLTVEVRTLTLLKKEPTPSQVEYAVQVDEDGRPMRAANGEEMLEPLKKSSESLSFWQRIAKKEDGDNEAKDGNDEGNVSGSQDDDQDDDYELTEEVALEDLADAIRYGRDLVPYSEQDRAGNKFEEDCGYEDDTLDVADSYIHIMGYVGREFIPKRFLAEPPWVISGWDSKRACTLVAALARTLDKNKFVALCSFKNSKNGRPALGGLFAYEEKRDGEGFNNRLLLFKLPYSDDIKPFMFNSFESLLDEDGGSYGNDGGESKQKSKKMQASDDLIDSMMLPNEALCSDRIPSPYHVSFYKTLLRKVLRSNGENSNNDEDDIVAVREQFDRMAIPPDVLARSKPAVAAFREAHPLRTKKMTVRGPTGRGNDKKAATYEDYLFD